MRGCMIERGDHRLLWDTRWRFGTVNEPVAGEWKEPPDYPNLLSAINRALGQSKKFLAERFFEERLSDAAYEGINKEIMTEVRAGALELDESSELRANVEHHLIGIDSYSGLTTGCRQPYRLSRDCNNRKGALRSITINDVRTRVAGNKEGDVVLLMAPNIRKVDAPEEVRNGFIEVALLLEENGLRIGKMSAMSVIKKHF